MRAVAEEFAIAKRSNRRSCDEHSLERKFLSLAVKSATGSASTCAPLRFINNGNHIARKHRCFTLVGGGSARGGVWHPLAYVFEFIAKIRHRVRISMRAAAVD